MSLAQKISTQNSFSQKLESKNTSIFEGQLTLYTFHCLPLLNKENLSDNLGIKKNHNQENIDSVSDQTPYNQPLEKLISIPARIEDSLKNEDLGRFSAWTKGQDDGKEGTRTLKGVGERVLKTLARFTKTTKQETSGNVLNIPVNPNRLFDAENTENLYSLGNSFYKKYKNGKKHFSFSHFGAADAQKRSVLGIASLLNYFESLNILIITGHMDGSVFGKIKENPVKTKKVVTNCTPHFHYETMLYREINFVEIEYLAQLFKEKRVKGRELFLKNLLEEYDVVLYDLPTLHQRKQNYEIYFSFFQLIEEVTLTLTLKKDTFTDVEKLGRYFQQHNIGINGCILDDKFIKERIVP